jgi:hypothetical protein
MVLWGNLEGIGIAGRHRDSWEDDTKGVGRINVNCIH